jgi:haloalkane dehalogenase
MTRTDDDEGYADFPFESRYVDVLGSRMHYVEQGNGDPVLLVHGNGCSSYIWRNIIPYIAPHGRAIALDLVGMGRSEPADIEYRFQDHVRYFEAFIEALGLRNITLVLHDWGSGLGFHYARRNEDNVKGLVFFADAMLTPIEGWDQYTPEQRDAFQAFRTPEVGWDLIVNQNAFIEQVIPSGIVRTLSDREMAAYRAPYADPARRTPLWRWPNELPIDGDPPDVSATVAEYSDWLRETELPKLLLHAVYPENVRPVPMSGVVNALDRAQKHPTLAWCKDHLKNLDEKVTGVGIHYVQEDNFGSIGRGLDKWLPRLGRRSA